MRSDEQPQIRLHAYAETEENGPTLLQVYIVNQSPGSVDILNDLDSINIPPRPPRAGEAIDDADLMHVDFGESGTGALVTVAPEEAVKVTLILNGEQTDLLARVKAMKTTVKWRRTGEPASDVQRFLLPATVHVTRP